MLDNQIDQRFKRMWSYFTSNAGELLLGALVVLIGSLLIIPGPWFALNLLQEVLEAARAGRPVRWQATYERSGNFWRSWGLTLAMGIPLLVGFCLLIVPGVLLALYWFHAPALVADGRRVFDALGEAGRLFKRRKDWATYFLNWLVVAALLSAGSAFFLALLLTLPLAIVYFVLCYTDETGPVAIEVVAPKKVEAPV